MPEYKRGHHPNSRNGFNKNPPIKQKNVNWKGDDAGYAQFHIWLTNNYGQPRVCENPTCKYPRLVRHGTRKILLVKPLTYHWALKKDKKHSHKRENYMRLCITCHRLYDYNKIKICQKKLKKK